MEEDDKLIDEDKENIVGGLDINSKINFVSERLKAYNFVLLEDDKGNLDFLKKDKIEFEDRNFLLDVLIKLLKREEEKKSSEEKLRKVYCDYDNLQSLLQKRKTELLNTQNLLAKEKEASKTAKIEMEKELERHKRISKEIKQKNSNLIQQIEQFEKKNSKNERNLQKHQEKINSLLNSSNSVNSKGKFQTVNQQQPFVEVLNVFEDEISKKEKVSSIWKHKLERNENRLYQDVVRAFEDEKKELESENLELKRCLKENSEQLALIRNIIYSKKGIKEYETDVKEINEDSLKVPFNYSKDEIKDILKSKIDEIWNLLKRNDFLDSKSENNFENLKVMNEKFEILAKIMKDNISDVSLYDEASLILKTLSDRILMYQDFLIQQQNLLDLVNHEYNQNYHFGILNAFQKESNLLKDERNSLLIKQQSLINDSWNKSKEILNNQN